MYLAFCDDEASGRASLAALLEAYRAEKLPSLRWASFQSPYALLAAVERERFDAVLLDILMPEMDGMRVARALRAVNASIDLVFLTSSPDYAVESLRCRRKRLCA